MPNKAWKTPWQCCGKSGEATSLIEGLLRTNKFGRQSFQKMFEMLVAQEYKYLGRIEDEEERAREELEMIEEHIRDNPETLEFYLEDYTEYHQEILELFNSGDR
ncbi:MAG: hypothetical protein M2R45_03715 [Verrucomicrobia subdivision 3 bacterium]|nr:hypothetical protein [Limisphaerales bacterium]MCS1416961.1 hypothetical protein [Limisphaerales bacterium]